MFSVHVGKLLRRNSPLDARKLSNDERCALGNNWHQMLKACLLSACHQKWSLAAFITFSKRFSHRIAIYLQSQRRRHPSARSLHQLQLGWPTNNCLSASIRGMVASAKPPSFPGSQKSIWCCCSISSPRAGSKAQVQVLVSSLYIIQVSALAPR